ncbi:deuterolysin m35 metalloprotease [Moniliophthora roreri MCA 2997]|uniref:Deuterolysin m35 metalloprotease n=1 Tax=Moniliophthora roreri (strain MCA 2997) TaxID=1381753 RepID=V2YVY5_MONRO|nr:deuterolysin m35 metalloprotease [Moniliophthora roreri MCA 2997]
MFSSALLVFTLSHFAFAANSNLEVKVSAPATSSVDNLKLTVVVTNLGAEDVKVLKYGTVLDDSLPTRAFTVTKNGVEVPFVGMRLFTSPEDANDSAYTVVPAHGSIEVKHDSVASLYDFASSGEGSYHFEPVVDFFTANSVAPVVESHAFDVKVAGPVQPAARHVLDTRMNNVCSDPVKAALMDQAYAEAQLLANTAYNYIGNTGDQDALYLTYWKNSSVGTIQGVYDKIIHESDSPRNFQCATSCSSGVIAYRWSGSPHIYVCPPFFNYVSLEAFCAGSTKGIRGGTILHELSHVTSSRADVTQGSCSNAKALNPTDSARNAASYSCFARDVYKNTQC